jgi:hypothetical protein
MSPYEKLGFSSFFNKNCIFLPTKGGIWKIIRTFAVDFYTYHSLTGRFRCGMTTGVPGVERGFLGKKEIQGDCSGLRKCRQTNG